VAGAAYWAIPNHYLIAICYIILLIGLALFLIYDARQWLANLSAARDGEKSRHP
jgi:hypothetical protein